MIRQTKLGTWILSQFSLATESVFTTEFSVCVITEEGPIIKVQSCTKDTSLEDMNLIHLTLIG